jgi:hypothetical protein
MWGGESVGAGERAAPHASKSADRDRAAKKRAAIDTAPSLGVGRRGHRGCGGGVCTGGVHPPGGRGGAGGPMGPLGGHLVAHHGAAAPRSREGAPPAVGLIKRAFGGIGTQRGRRARARRTLTLTGTPGAPLCAQARAPVEGARRRLPRRGARAQARAAAGSGGVERGGCSPHMGGLGRRHQGVGEGARGFRKGARSSQTRGGRRPLIPPAFACRRRGAGRGEAGWRRAQAARATGAG